MYEIHSNYTKGNTLAPNWNVKGRTPLATRDEFVEAVTKYRSTLPPATKFDLRHTREVLLQLQECKRAEKGLVSFGDEDLSRRTVIHYFNLAVSHFQKDG